MEAPGDFISLSEPSRPQYTSPGIPQSKRETPDAPDDDPNYGARIAIINIAMEC